MERAARMVDVFGPGWVAVLLRDAEAVLALQPDLAAWTADNPLSLGAVGPWPRGSECELEVRAFFSDGSGALREDPVTGSLNASLAQWLVGARTVPAPYTAAQGTALGRSGRVRVEQGEDGVLWIGGATRSLLTGSVTAAG